MFVFVNVCLWHARDSLKGGWPSDFLVMVLCWLANVYFYVFIFPRRSLLYSWLTWNAFVAESELELRILVILPSEC